MRILAVDTATTVSSVAFLENGQLSAEATFPPNDSNGVTVSGKSNHSETVLPLIQSVLDRAHRRFSDVDAIAVSIGPGSFTGLRIGLALVKGLAYDCNLPVVGVSSLEAQALRVSELPDTVCPLIDARKQEVYAALFKKLGGKLERCVADQAIGISELINLFGATPDTTPIAFVGNGAERYREHILHLFDGRAQLIGDACGCSAAGAVARIALERLAVGSGTELRQLAPLYLGASQALGNNLKIVSNQLN